MFDLSPMDAFEAFNYVVDAFYADLIENNSINTVRFAKNLSQDVIKKIQQLFIKVRENDYHNETIEKFKKILVSVFVLLP